MIIDVHCSISNLIKTFDAQTVPPSPLELSCYIFFELQKNSLFLVPPPPTLCGRATKKGLFCGFPFKMVLIRTVNS